jgi:uncharacterized protein YdiU (UPF0061 family)
MELEIREFTRVCRCEINKCRNRADLSIGVPDGPAATRINICSEHLEQIVTKGADRLGLKFAENDNQPLIDDLTKQLEAKDAAIELLENKLAELEGSKQDGTIETMSRNELLSLAKDLNIEGKFATMKTADLIEKIKEAQQK